MLLYIGGMETPKRKRGRQLLRQAIDQFKNPARYDDLLWIMDIDIQLGSGSHHTVISRRHAWWCNELISKDVNRGEDVAAKILKVTGDSCPVHIDLVGVDASDYDYL